MNEQQKPTSYVPQWMAFSGIMLDKLPPGKYPLRKKISITPPVPGINECSPEDQLLFSAVDEMERSLLNSVIQNKVRELNKDKVKILICQVGTPKTVSDVEGREQNLVIIDNKLVGQQLKSAVKNLAELLAMAYDQILLPVRMAPGSSTNLAIPNDVTFCLQDHTYCVGEARQSRPESSRRPLQPL